MMKKIVLVCTLMITYSLSAMVFDNRYLPLIQKPYISIYDRPSHLYFDLFFVTGSSAYGYEIDQTEIPIPQLYGTFNQGALGRAMSSVGLPNPLPLVLQRANIPWAMSGKLQTEGFSFSTYVQITNHFGAGLYWMAMRSNARTVFNLQAGTAGNVILTQEEALMLEDIRREMFQEIGIDCGFSNQVGMGDLDIYLRYRWEKDFAYKFRHIDIGLRFGALIPTGEQKEVNNPSSIPFGGNGFYGIYGAFDSEFEVREDWKAGFWLRASKRFKRDRAVRFPVADVSQLFSPVTGCASINPGATVAFLPFFYVENIREGFGMGVQYTLIKHWRDRWIDLRSVQEPAVDIAVAENTSRWSSDYATVNLFYDFGKVKSDRGFAPIALLTWDIPVDFILAEGAIKAHKVSLGVQFNF